MSYTKQIEDIVYRVFDAVDCPIQKNQFYVQDLGVPHKPKTLPFGKMAVYMFIHDERFIKIGQADKNSGPRFLSQHYTGSAQSTLRASLLSDISMKDYGLTEINIADWMKHNLQRIDIIIDAELGKLALTLVEAAMHFTFKPKYEGKSK